jgi:hypothetical protein
MLFRFHLILVVFHPSSNFHIWFLPWPPFSSVPRLSPNPIPDFIAQFFTSRVLSYCHVFPPISSFSFPYFRISLVWFPEGRPGPRQCSLFCRCD